MGDAKYSNTSSKNILQLPNRVFLRLFTKVLQLRLTSRCVFKVHTSAQSYMGKGVHTPLGNICVRKMGIQPVFVEFYELYDVPLALLRAFQQNENDI